MSQPSSFSLSSQLRVRAQEALDDMRAIKWRLLAVAAVVLVGLGYLAVTHLVGSSAAAASPSSDEYSDYPPTTSATTTKPLAQSVVYVVGAVKNPGLYKVETTARVSDAIDAAGGLSVGADPTRLNLAAKVTDGQRIYIVAKGETAPADVGPSGDGSSGSGSGAAQGPVDINNASEQELENLPGVGPSTAAAIVQYRTQHGTFASVNDLDKVKGIGPSKLAQIKDAATV